MSTTRSVRWPAVVLALALTSPGCGSRDATPTPPGVTPPSPTTPTAPPTGNLLDTDGTLGARSMARHQLRINAGDRVRVTLTSAAFDPVLHVTMPNGITLTNDDARGDRTRSELELVVPTAGELKLGVSSFAETASGTYHVTVARVAAQPAVAPAVAATNTHHQTLINGRSFLAAGAPAAAGAAAPPAPAAPVPLRVGDRLQANLATGDSTLPSGEFVDAYEMVVAQPGLISLRMESRAIDSYLVVQAPDGTEQRNDDSNGTRDAQVDLQAVAGTYRIIATSYRAGETGAYELKALTSRDTVAPSTPAVAGAGETIERGELATGDRTLSSGEFNDEHTLNLVAGQTVHLEARSTAFDTYLIVRSPGGQQQDNDDQVPGNLNAGLDYVARETGPHQVLVTSYRPGMVGAYELVIRTSGSGAVAPATPPATPTPGTPTPPAAPPASAGAQQQRGSLAQGDRQLQSGEFNDSYPMQFPVGAPVAIRVESSAFDSYLIVRSPSGHQFDNDDFTPGNLNAGLDIPAAEAGNYDVMVTSYRPGEVGAYSLTATPGAGGAAVPSTPGTPSVPGGPTRPPGAATAGTHVWAISVGISDYPGGGNDLPECANDAVKIAEALRGQGLTTPEREILLTDARATRGAVQQAIQRVAREAQPDDVVVFFYSGHGGQSDTPSTDPEELDHIDETLFLYDGEMLDNDMGRLIGTIRARMTLFTLDSCFSGGFAKDVVNRPGVVGMFSSEEDVTSGVAGQFQAGGYLSHFLRMGIRGEADSDPRDNALTVGELTHYVWQQYGSQASDVRMQEGYQQVVIDRGAVRTANVLWRR